MGEHLLTIRVDWVKSFPAKRNNQVVSHIQTRDSLYPEKAQSPILPLDKPMDPCSE